MKQTLSVVQKIANRYAKQSYQDVVVAIEIINEPLPDKLPGTGPVVQYFKNAYGDVRSVSDTPVVMHDAFQKGTFWDGIVNSGGSSGGEFD